MLLPYEMNVKLTHPNAKVPTYATDGSGAMDLFAATGRIISGNVVEYNLGFCVELPKDYSLFIFSRSGQGFNFQQRLSNCVGIIDSDYRGEVKVQIIADSLHPSDNAGHIIQHPIKVLTDKAIAQATVIYTPKIKINVVNQLSETVRGTGGFGSTDTHKGITE